MESPVLGIAFECLRAILVAYLSAARTWRGLKVECVSVGNRLHVEGYSQIEYLQITRDRGSRGHL